MCADEGKVAADDAVGGERGGGTHINGAGLDHLDVIAQSERGVPVGKDAGVQLDRGCAGDARRSEEQGALADDGVARVVVGGIGETEDADAGLHKAGRTGDLAGEGDDAGRIGDTESAVGGTGEIHGSAQSQINLALCAPTDEPVRRKGTHCIARASQGTENAGAGEVDVVGDGHRLQQADRGGDTEAGLIHFQCAAVEGNRSRAECARIGDPDGGVAVDGGATGEGVRGVENHRAAVANEIGSGSAGDRADDDGVGTGEDRGVDLQRAAAGAEAIRAARADSEGGGGVVTTGCGAEEETVVRPEDSEVQGGAVADHVDAHRAINAGVGGRESEIDRQRTVVAHPEGTDAVVVGVDRGDGGDDGRRI